MAQPIKVTTTGAAGSATGFNTGTAYGVGGGFVLKINASAPATTDIVIKRTINGIDQTIASFTDVDDTANGFYNPPNTLTAVAGGAVIADQHPPFVFGGEQITVTVSGSDALTAAVEVTFITVS